MSKITATVSVCRQIGMEDFKMFHHSKVFDKNATIEDMDSWAKFYGNNLSFFDLTFSSTE